MALCGMTAPHFTTLAHFVSSLRDDIAQVFAAVLAVCDGQGLIGREMFAIDGVKLPSNASTHRSGTRAEFTQRAEKLEQAAKTMLDRHRAADALEPEPHVAGKTTARIARLPKDAQQLREWLATHPADRHGRHWRATLEQSHGQRESEDGHRQRRDPSLHRRDRRGCEASDHRRGTSAWHARRAGVGAPRRRGARHAPQERDGAPGRRGLPE